MQSNLLKIFISLLLRLINYVHASKTAVVYTHTYMYTCLGTKNTCVHVHKSISTHIAHAHTHKNKKFKKKLFSSLLGIRPVFFCMHFTTEPHAQPSHLSSESSVVLCLFAEIESAYN